MQTLISGVPAAPKTEQEFLMCIESKNREVKEKEDLIADYRMQIHILRQTNAHLTAKDFSLQEEMTALQQTVEQLKVEKADMQRQLDAKDEEIRILRDQISASDAKSQVGDDRGGQPDGGDDRGGQPDGGDDRGGQTHGGDDCGGQTDGGDDRGGQTDGADDRGGQTNGGDDQGDNREGSSETKTYTRKKHQSAAKGVLLTGPVEVGSKMVKELAGQHGTYFSTPTL